MILTHPRIETQVNALWMKILTRSYAFISGNAHKLLTSSKRVHKKILVDALACVFSMLQCENALERQLFQ